ncbi:MAG: glycine zipper 2TM domain-containing protein, partial [Gammaproteobacteria bacterium]
IVGGIIGAVVGNQFGSGSGRDWATVAGTTLGASIGSDYNNRRHYTAGRSYTTNERSCRIVRDHQQEERADGYLVTYTYNGRRYKTRTENHPGDRIKVRLDVTPVE